MTLPDRLAGAVDDESVVAEVPLGGDDRLVVTPTRTLVYRADGLLSDETVETYGHDVERVNVSTGRRKAKLTLGYGLDGEKTISLPASKLEDALHPVLAGILSGTGVTESGESVIRTFRFSELTLVITSHRVVKHVGAAVWDEEFEEFPYDELTGLDFEEGTVATSVVLTHGGRSERFKAPNESARAVRETLTDAVCEFYEVSDLAAFRQLVAETEEESENDGPTTDFGAGPDPLSASPSADSDTTIQDADGSFAGIGAPGEGGADDAGTTDGMTVAEAATTESTESTESTDPLAVDALESAPNEPAGTGGEGAFEAGSAGGHESGTGPGEPSAVDDEGDAFEGSPFEPTEVREESALKTEVAALREAVEAQSDRLDRQAELIETLIEELRRGR
ncbi:DUF7115 domain-containing protein [Halorubrum vacuolatum]|uniref:DUF7115 domain-containing protein n=1 Tax=Halorubrum vacuolatum TaxID=63740 RepID=A0A238X6Y1_HALVU|nr:hypothetical protein [Halorubrum vacuolatum]SNR54338.1 hypothetical protein SAMN06264855_11412 [Halorubrum vacuolatum]